MATAFQMSGDGPTHIRRTTAIDPHGRLSYWLDLGEMLGSILTSAALGPGGNAEQRVPGAIVYPVI